MEFHTQQLVNAKIEENPLHCDYLQHYYQDPLPNSTTTAMFEAPQIDHGFNSVPLPLPQYYNLIPNMGFQGLEDYSPIAITFLSSPYCDYNILDAKTHPTLLESFGKSSNGQSDLGHHQASMMFESSGFSSTQCDPVVFDERPNSTLVDSPDYLINNPTDMGHHAMIESSAVSYSLCGSLALDEMFLREVVESLNTNVPIDFCQHEVSMMVESSGFSFSSSLCHYRVFNETPISTRVESLDNLSNVPSVFDHHEASMVNERGAAFSSSHCNALALYVPPLSPIVDSFDYSDIPTPAFSNDEVPGMSESEFLSWGTSDISCMRGTSSTSRYNKQMKIKSDALELEDIKQYFNLPITTAAKELKVGVTLLKRRCRELNIRRWPHRKIKSLNSLIETVKGMGLKNEVKMLEQNKRHLELGPNMGLTMRTKKLRQSIFKANYNKKKMSLSSTLG